MTGNAGAGLGLTKPGCQTRTNNTGAGQRVNPPSLNDTLTILVWGTIFTDTDMVLKKITIPV